MSIWAKDSSAHTQIKKKKIVTYSYQFNYYLGLCPYNYFSISKYVFFGKYVTMLMCGSGSQYTSVCISRHGNGRSESDFPLSKPKSIKFGYPDTRPNSQWDSSIP
jgi:hypothetical protein